MGYLTAEQIKATIAKAGSLRNILIVRLLYELGCSFNELVNIRLRDIDLEQNRIYFHGSSRAERHSIFSEKTKILIIQYIQYKGIQGKRLVYLLSAKIKPLSTRRLNQILTELIGNPQLLKYSHIINAYKAGISLSTIQAQVGLTKQRIIDIIMSLDEEADLSQYNSLFKQLNEPKT